MNGPLSRAVVGAITGDPATPVQCRSAGHSSFNATWQVIANGSRYFVKTAEAGRRSMFDAEAAGLRALATTGAVRVPAVTAVGGEEDTVFLVLEWLDIGPGGRDAALGRALAALHRSTSDRFGFHRDNTIGATPQVNAWIADWPAFFRDQRIAPQLALAAQRGANHRLLAIGERLLSQVEPLLMGHVPRPSLLHGDLWAGNAGQLATGEPVLFDPAVYFGDREADLAMSELFGGFTPDFYAAYRDAWPVDAGYGMRRELYNLYHVLNHFNLFGGGYGHQAEAMIAHLLAQAR
jgi:fructosamine-3-kinase